LQIFTLKPNEIARRFASEDVRAMAGFTAVDAPLDLRLSGFAWRLRSPGPGLQFSERRQDLCAACAVSDRTAA
jgi:hypothetical protein